MGIIKDEGPLLETVVIEPELPRRQVRTQNQDKCNMTVIDDNCYPYWDSRKNKINFPHDQCRITLLTCRTNIRDCKQVSKVQAILT